MYSKNDEVLRDIDIALLDEKYVSKLGIGIINQISGLPHLKQKLLRLNDRELEVITTLYNYFSTKGEGLSNEEAFEILLGNTDKCRVLINDITDISEIDLANLTAIFLNENSYKIDKSSDIQRLSEIKHAREENDINSGEVDLIRRATISRIFGISEEQAIKILQSYCEGINSIADEELKRNILRLKQIKEIKSTTELVEIYNSGETIDFSNFILVERKLKNEYGKLLNNGALKVEGLEKIDHNIYKAGTNFKAIMTSIHAFSSKDKKEESYDSYKESWNRPKLGIPHFCTSYIRNDMLASPPINDVCFGFSELDEGSLLMMGEEDISSTSWNENFVPTANGRINFLDPDNLINKTTGNHNELDYKRIQKDGKKKQPDYIVFFRRDGSKEMTPEELIIWQNTQKASRDFGDLPIVVIDVEECLNSERQKLESLLTSYRESPNIENTQELYYKIRNNRMTTERWGGDFSPEIDLQEILETLKSLQKEQLESDESTKSNLLKSAIEATITTRNGQINNAIQNIAQIQKEKGLQPERDN